MKKFITVIAVVCMVALAAGQAFAGKTFKPEEINTTAGKRENVIPNVSRFER